MLTNEVRPHMSPLSVWWRKDHIYVSWGGEMCEEQASRASVLNYYPATIPDGNQYDERDSQKKPYYDAYFDMNSEQNGFDVWFDQSRKEGGWFADTPHVALKSGGINLRLWKPNLTGNGATTKILAKYCHEGWKIGSPIIVWGNPGIELANEEFVSRQLAIEFAY